MKKIHTILAIGLSFVGLSCSDFLDEKPDIKMVIPRSLEDAALLLNDYSTMNMGYPLAGEWSSDEYYLPVETWQSIANQDQRNAYIWMDEPYEDAVQWQRPYKVVYMANQVLEIINERSSSDNISEYKRIYGAAHFFRAFAFHQLIEVYTPAYRGATASAELGIPLRLSPDIDVAVARANLEESVYRVISDYRTAVAHLPTREQRKGQPSKAAAYAGLARVYLGIGLFEEAFLHADSAIQLSPTLLDYNTLNVADNFPIPRFNVEVLFPAMSMNAGLMGFNVALVDSTLHKTYEEEDLRKTIYFNPNPAAAGGHFYRGNYDRTAGQLFVGLTTSEMYLIKAEAAIRLGKTATAQEALNTLLTHRYETGFTPDTMESDPTRLLERILQERRKELLFRGRRWSDLKRLNTEERFQKTLKRNMGQDQFELLPQDLRYAVRLPESAVRVGNLEQNKR